MNILSNAFKYTPTKGNFVVSVTHDTKNATISVKDSGPGITENTLPYIFDRFYQVNNHANNNFWEQA